MRQWRGQLVSTLSMSYGIVSYCDHKEATIDKLLIMADQTMYANKALYYSNKKTIREDSRS